MRSLKELEEDYGKSVKIDILGLEEIHEEPREAFLPLIPPRIVDPRLSPCRVDRAVLVSFARDVLLRLDRDLTAFAATVLRERNPSPQDDLLAEMKEIRKLLEDQD